METDPLARITQEGDALVWRHRGEWLRVEPWGRGAVRVRAGLVADRRPAELSALLPAEPAPVELGLGPAASAAGAGPLWEHGEPLRDRADGGATLRNGPLLLSLSHGGRLRFFHAASGAPVLEEVETYALARRSARAYRPLGRGDYEVRQAFAAAEGERFFGLGHHEHARADLKGAVVDLFQRNTEVCVPFVLSTRGYGFLWNTPAIGRVEFGAEQTRWVAEAGGVIDYWVTVSDSFPEILRAYADATGHAPHFPRWASGLWQSNCRYLDQAEILRVSDAYAERGLPVSVLVIDFLHSRSFGDWSLDPAHWPEPAALSARLRERGTRVMVSVWPSVNPRSAHYPLLQERGHLLATEHGPTLHFVFRDIDQERATLAYYDPTHPGARDFMWARFEESYLRHGITIPWLDACEPAVGAFDHANLRYALGPGLLVGSYYCEANIRAFAPGLRAALGDDAFMLSRSVWAGSQRHPVCLFPGDLFPSFAVLRRQIAGHLNLGLCGIQWHSTDIGGFLGGDPDDPAMRELQVRWAQFALFNPVFRMHGDRDPRAGEEERENEIWSYGEEAYAILRELVLVREAMRPRIHELMDEASRSGLPMMRPLWLEFPADPEAFAIDDAFLWGEDTLVAPVVEAGARRRRVYLPRGASWTHVQSGVSFAGGAWVEVDAPLAQLPLFLCEGAARPEFAAWAPRLRDNVRTL